MVCLLYVNYSTILAKYDYVGNVEVDYLIKKIKSSYVRNTAVDRIDVWCFLQLAFSI
jgi:hypothetical protein